MGRKKNEMRQDREREREPIVANRGKPFCLSKLMDKKIGGKKQKLQQDLYSCHNFRLSAICEHWAERDKMKEKKYSKEKRNKTTEVSYRL